MRLPERPILEPAEIRLIKRLQSANYWSPELGLTKNEKALLAVLLRIYPELEPKESIFEFEDE